MFWPPEMSATVSPLRDRNDARRITHRARFVAENIAPKEEPFFEKPLNVGSTGFESVHWNWPKHGTGAERLSGRRSEAAFRSDGRSEAIR
jgi:hypothetical protein